MMTAAGTWSEASPLSREPAGDATQGWYLYGVTRRGLLATTLAEADAGRRMGASPTAATGDDAHLELLECCGLAAVVKPVPLADFSLAVLQEPLRSASELETMVRSHNLVIEAVHARQAILPAKFGMVYTRARDILSALRSACDTLLLQLHRLEGCDEWALHLYADRAIVQDRIAARTPAIGRLLEECATARPGRAYFLERRFRDELGAASRQALVTLAQTAFDRLAISAVAGEVNRVGSLADGASEVEILRAAFLVARDGAEHFAAEVRTVADADEGLRAESSGPWPPYSFSVWEQAE